MSNSDLNNLKPPTTPKLQNPGARNLSMGHGVNPATPFDGHVDGEYVLGEDNHMVSQKRQKITKELGIEDPSTQTKGGQNGVNSRTVDVARTFSGFSSPRDTDEYIAARGTHNPGEVEHSSWDNAMEKLGNLFSPPSPKRGELMASKQSVTPKMPGLG